MAIEPGFCILESATLKWPPDLRIPSKRFRLFVAANTTDCTTRVISEFVLAALQSGMVYFSAWGPGCSRFHDIVDEELVADEIGEGVFASPSGHDTIMTTWHESHTLDEALDFFIRWTKPDGKFQQGSEYWVAVSVNNPHWAASIRRTMEAAKT